MATLSDVAKVPRQVPVNGVSVDVFGVSGEGFAMLMARFPEVKNMMDGKKVNKGELMKLAPRALAAFIAAGTGHPGNVEMEEVARTLPVGAQADLIEEILRLTFPRGVGPFVEQLQQMGLLVQLGGSVPSAET